MSITETPQAITELRRFLTGQQFIVLSEQRGGMGGFEQIFAGDIQGQRVFVRITSDRGHWVLQIRVAQMSAWITPGVWLAHLDDHDVTELSVEDQSVFVAQRLAEVLAAVIAMPTLEERLVRMGEEYMRRRLM